MSAHETVVTEDRSYKPSSPEMPEKRYVIETGEFRWEAFVTRYVVIETGTPIYHAVVENEQSAYGLTPNEAVNELAGIMGLQAMSYERKTRTIRLSRVRGCIDARDAESECAKAAGNRSHYSFIRRFFGLL